MGESYPACGAADAATGIAPRQEYFLFSPVKPPVMTLRPGLPLLAGLLLFSGCRQSDPAPAVTPKPPAGTLTARMEDNTQPFTAYQVQATNQGTIVLEASRGTSEILRLQFPASSSPGSYAFSTSAYTQLALEQYGTTPRELCLLFVRQPDRQYPDNRS